MFSWVMQGMNFSVHFLDLRSVTHVSSLTRSSFELFEINVSSVGPFLYSVVLSYFVSEKIICRNFSVQFLITENNFSVILLFKNLPHNHPVSQIFLITTPKLILNRFTRLFIFILLQTVFNFWPSNASSILFTFRIIFKILQTSWRLLL